MQLRAMAGGYARELEYTPLVSSRYASALLMMYIDPSRRRTRYRLAQPVGIADQFPWPAVKIQARLFVSSKHIAGPRRPTAGMRLVSRWSSTPRCLGIAL